MASLSAPPETLKVKFRGFWIFGPRVSRVPQFFCNILILGFLQLIEGTFHLNNIPVTLSKLIVGIHNPNKT
jgi:hypothetical protein